MKLIIDIPEEVLESRQYCQYFGVWSTKLTETIENGKPYEERPKGKWLDVIYADNGIGVGMCNQCGIHRTIDNFCPICGADMQKGGADMRLES